MEFLFPIVFVREEMTNAVIVILFDNELPLPRCVLVKQRVEVEGGSSGGLGLGVWSFLLARRL